MTFTWSLALRQLRSQPELRNHTRSGGRNSAGREQRVYGDAGLWEIKSQALVNNRAAGNAYRAMMARLRAGEDMYVRVWNKLGPDGAFEAAASASLNAAAVRRDTALSLSVMGIDLMAGNYLTVGASRLHIITEIVSGPGQPVGLGPWQVDDPWDDGSPWLYGDTQSGAYTVKILPPLRSDLAAGTNVSFANLFVRCVLKDVDDGDLELDAGRYGRPTLTFIETY